MAKKLTELGVERLSAKKSAYTRVVDGNLYIKVNPSGKKIWMYRYTESGTEKRRWISLGEFTEINDRSRIVMLLNQQPLRLTDVSSYIAGQHP